MSYIRLPSYITPDGTAQHTRLYVPDTKLSLDGFYSVKMQFTGEEAQALAQFLDTKMEDSYKEAKKENPSKRIKKADAPHQWNDNGTLSINFKMKASGVTKDGKAWSRKPPILNADLTPYEGAEISDGNKLVISYTPAPFYTGLIGSGISMRLEAVQVIGLPEPVIRPANYGFNNRDQQSPSVLTKIKVYLSNQIRSRL